MTHRLTFTIPALAFSALALASCSSDIPSGSASTAATAMTATAATAAATAAATTAPEATDPTSDDANTVEVTISGGYETNPVDHGRPVVLVASLLGVSESLFREAFSGVSPAAAGDEPDSEQVASNKNALLSVLGPHGVSNDQLDVASNAYRYAANRGEVWARRPATATATIVDGRVTSITITDHGRGYTSPPVVTIEMPDGSTLLATATVDYTSDFETNGSIGSITVSTR